MSCLLYEEGQVETLNLPKELWECWWAPTSAHTPRGESTKHILALRLCISWNKTIKHSEVKGLLASVIYKSCNREGVSLKSTVYVVPLQAIYRLRHRKWHCYSYPSQGQRKRRHTIIIEGNTHILRIWEQPLVQMPSACVICGPVSKTSAVYCIIKLLVAAQTLCKVFFLASRSRSMPPVCNYYAIVNIA